MRPLSSAISVGDEDHPPAVQREEAGVHRPDPQRPERLRAGHQERADSAQAQGWKLSEVLVEKSIFVTTWLGLGCFFVDVVVVVVGKLSGKLRKKSENVRKCMRCFSQ